MIVVVAFALALQQTPGQSLSTITVRSGEKTTTVPVLLIDRGPVIAADALADALGGSIELRARDEYAVSLAGLRLGVTAGVPFVRAGDQTLTLAGEPVLRGGKLYLPYSFVSDFLPRAAKGVTFDARRAVLQRVVVATPAVVAKPHPFTVVVDAGHGGPDRGMHGPIGADWEIREKDITLDVALALRTALTERGVGVIMTRSTDTLIALSDRGRIANAKKGDVFVSIHVNAANPNWKHPGAARGFETYFLSEARTEDARRVEAMENEVVKYEIANDVSANDPLSFVVHDMEQNQHLRESSELASTVQRSLAKMHPGPDRGVKQAGFRVLVTAFMPAVLVEIGFGTNAAEARYLRDPRRQREIAASIADATMDYLKAYQRRSTAANQ
jgi:N-acetylmuramoyl-L-alanine amidase